MQFSFLLSVVFAVFTLAVPLERRDYKEQELKKFNKLKKLLFSVGYNVENYFCRNGVYYEKFNKSSFETKENTRFPF